MYYIRVDGNEIIGTGHVMRCLSIAEEFCKQGDDVIFIIADERPSAMISECGFRSICLNSVWNDLDKETELLIKLIMNSQIKLLLLDSYFVTQSYLEAISRYTRTVYIDDMDMFLYPVDLLINYNIYAANLDYITRYQKAGSHTAFALGSQYVPLRSEFQNVKHDIRDKVKRILVTSGGTDCYNFVGNFLSKVKEQWWFDNLEYEIIIGRFNTNRDNLKIEWDSYSNVHLYTEVTNMSEHMKSCDIAVTAGGVTTYELCACGIPSVMYTLADNQFENARATSKQGLIPWCGDIRDNMSECLSTIIKKIDVLLQNKNLREIQSKKMQTIVDGEGCRRIVKKIKNFD